MFKIPFGEDDGTDFGVFLSQPCVVILEDADIAFQSAMEAAQNADVVIAVMGETQDMAGEFASRGSLDLPGR